MKGLIEAETTRGRQWLPPWWINDEDGVGWLELALEQRSQG
jgi:hypothetical protein